MTTTRDVYSKYLADLTATCEHAPSSHIGFIMFVTIGAYVLDYLYCMFVLTYRVETSHFWRLEQGVQLSFSNPAGWRDITGYVSSTSHGSRRRNGMPSRPHFGTSPMMIAGRGAARISSKDTMSLDASPSSSSSNDDAPGST